MSGGPVILQQKIAESENKVFVHLFMFIKANILEKEQMISLPKSDVQVLAGK